MNFIHHFRNVMDRMAEDPELDANHVSLYIALFHHWNRFLFRVPLAIIREDLMRVSKIASPNTYTNCLRELERRGYLKYEPSFSPRRPSHVHLYKFDKGGHKGARKGGDQAARKGDRKAAVKVVIPELNNTNDINLTNPINDLNDASTLKKSFDQSGKRNKKTSDIPGSLHDPLPDIKKKGAGRPGSVEAVKAWFAEQQSTATAAEKFYYYYEGIGWKIGGRTAMKSWKAFARYWIKNEKTATYETDKHKPGTKLKPGTLHVAPGKNYDEPL